MKDTNHPKRRLQERLTYSRNQNVSLKGAATCAMIVKETGPGPGAASASGSIRAILFDMDGTLLDTETLSDKSIFDAFGDALDPNIRKRMHDKLPWEIKEPTLGKRGDEWIPMVIEYASKHWNLRSPPPSTQEFWYKQERLLNDMCDQVQECKGATALAELLASNSNVPMCIATSSRMVSVDKKRKHHSKIFDHMEFVVTGESVENGKPAPDLYLEAARQIKVDPKHCMVFEDAIAGCQAAKNAGCGIVIAVPDSRCNPSVFDGLADEVLTDLTCFDAKAYGLLN